ncbi:MAG TPA: hypothetical protein VGB52_10870 [Actinomycetota bacterium]
MDLLGRLRVARAPRRPAVEPAVDAIEFAEQQPVEEACPRCGERYERLLDPAGRWFVCTRCGHRTEREEPA